MSKAERLAFVPKITSAITSGKDSDIEGVFAQDFKMLIPGTGGREAKDVPIPPGIEGPKAVIGSLHKAFSDFKFYPLKSVAEDDGGENIVATRAEFTGVHTGEFMGVPATGKSIVGRFAAFDRIVDGKLVSSEIFMDVTSLLIQLGAMEPPKGF